MRWASFGLRVAVTAMVAGAALGGCNESEPRRETLVTVRGAITGLSPQMREVEMSDSTGARWAVAVPTESPILGEWGDTVTLADLLPEFEVAATGRVVDSARLVAERLAVLHAPNIILTRPEDGDTLTAPPLVIRGYARVFENRVLYRIFALGQGSTPRPVARGLTTARSRDVGRHGLFQIEWNATTPGFFPPSVDRLVVEVFSEDARDGSLVNRVARTVVLNLPRTVFLYFPNGTFDPHALDCRTVYPVERTLPRSARAVDILSALLAGPTEAEKEQGYLTALPEDARVGRVRIAAGVAYVDFASLDAAGSCPVMAVRAQIERTLLANLPVNAVIISVQGRSGTALQP